MASREYLVDVANYQSTSMASYHNAGAKQIIAKLTEGQSYINPKAHEQIKSAHAHHMFVHVYHFATFSNSVAKAKLEGKHFVSRAKHENISKKRFLYCDWEIGDDNSVVGSKASNTKAILAFMKVCHDAGYKVGLYSSASLLRSSIDIAKIIKKYGTCIWVAAYPRSGAVSTPDFNYFPSMDGVAVWQFTDNWCGLGVDGNITLKELITDSIKKVQKKSMSTKDSHNSGTQKEQKSEKKTGFVYAPVISHNPNWMIQLMDENGHYTGKYIKTNTRWKYFNVKTIKGMKCYKLGTDKQWVPAEFLKIIE